MKNPQRRIRELFFLLFFLILTSCVAVNSAASTPMPISTQTRINRTIPSATYNFPLLSLTHASTHTPPPAPSGLPPTWTPLPTYPPDQADQVVMSLYEKNTCRLPCWWGITPGKTSWLDAWQFLGRFATNRAPWDTLLVESKNLPGYMYFQVYLDVPKTPDEYYYLSLNDLWFVINIDTFDVDYIDVNTGNIEAYTIPKILSNYGEPKEIYVDIGGGGVAQLSGVSLLLYYPQYGFISNHFTTADLDQLDKPNFLACFQKVTNLYLWSPSPSIDLNTRLKISGVDPITIGLLKPIDQVSDFNVSTFYKTFVNAPEQPCIEFKH